MKTLKLQRVTRYFGYILLAVVTFTPLQWCWNKFASMCKINLWAMKNTNGKMCLWRFAFGFPVGCLHYQKGFVGDCKITYVMDGW